MSECVALLEANGAFCCKAESYINWVSCQRYNQQNSVFTRLLSRFPPPKKKIENDSNDRKVYGKTGTEATTENPLGGAAAASRSLYFTPSFFLLANVTAAIFKPREQTPNAACRARMSLFFT